jgi:hypothetical protein
MEKEVRRKGDIVYRSLYDNSPMVYCSSEAKWYAIGMGQVSSAIRHTGDSVIFVERGGYADILFREVVSGSTIHEIAFL